MAIVLLYSVAAIFIKAALVFFYLRILTTIWQRVLCWVTFFIIVVGNLEAAFYNAFACGKPSAAHVMSGACQFLTSATIKEMYSQISVSLICDIVLMSLPLPTILSSSLHWKTKLSAAIVLLVAGVLVAFRDFLHC
jgi:hypothetical protein